MKSSKKDYTHKINKHSAQKNRKNKAREKSSENEPASLKILEKYFKET
jgi:hypothetical protein